MHDAGGRDGALLDCISGHVPTWAEAIVCLCVLLMILFRPAYNWLQRRHIVK